MARLAQLALGVACAVFIASEAKRRVTECGALPRGVLAALIAVLALASTLRSPDAEMAVRELGVVASMVAVALVVAWAREPILAPARVVSIASAAYVAVVLLVTAGVLAGQTVNRAEIFVGYDNYRFFNHVQSASLPLTVLAMTVAPRRSRLRAVAWFAAVGGFALLFTVAGRGTMVGIVVGAVAVAALFGRNAVATLRNLAAAAALGMLLFALLFWLLPVLTGMTPEFSDGYYGARLGSVEARFFLWRIAQSYIEQSPWLGIGPMHYAHFHNPEAAHPHNIYLQIAAEWGVPMLLLLLGLAFWALRRFALAVRACADVRQRNCGIGLFLACVAIAVDGLFSGNFVMPVSQVWIAFTFGWAMAWMAGQRGPEQFAPAGGGGRFSPGRLAAIGLLVSQLWLVWSVWPEVRHLDEHIQQTMERVPNATMNPRFWSHGWF
ncbi:MAG TPA: O-antigen ligase family protein [Rubrivivax sp.]|nr:O-antigen ligase family protein [Rubrivivax sp.]